MTSADLGGAGTPGQTLRFRPPRRISALSGERLTDLQNRPGKESHPYPASGYGPAPAARSTTQLGRAVRVAMIDGHVDDVHKALATQVVVRVDLSRLAPGSTPADHGTGLAGLVCGSDGEQYTGIEPRAELIAIEVAGWNARVLSDGVAIAIALRADIVLVAGFIPLEFPEDAAELKALLARAGEAAPIIVTAAGNRERAVDLDLQTEGSSLATVDDPHICVVTSVTGLGHYVRGSCSWGAKRVDVAAQGVDLWVPYPGPTSRYAREDEQSTSMACAVVAGHLARALASGGAMTPSEALARVLASATSSAELAQICATGCWLRP